MTEGLFIGWMFAAGYLAAHEAKSKMAAFFLAPVVYLLGSMLLVIVLWFLTGHDQSALSQEDGLAHLTLRLIVTTVIAVWNANAPAERIAKDRASKLAKGELP